MTDRISTGNAGLDAVLGGGLLADSITLVSGAPGSGKTVLAQQCLFAAGTPRRPAVYLTTVSEPFDKAVRYAQQLEFFDVSRVGTSVIYEDLGNTLVEDGLQGVAAAIDDVLKRLRPGLLVIDSFKAIDAFADGAGDFRRFLHTLAVKLSTISVTAVWIGEYAPDDAVSRPEFAVADAVLHLDDGRGIGESRPSVTVYKERGGSFLHGRHTARVDGTGLQVFPRLVHLPAMVRDVRDSYGPGSAPALDEALGDGIWRGSSTILVGPPGCGKTIVAAAFLHEGAVNGEPGLLATLRRTPDQADRIWNGLGWTLADEPVTVMFRSPVALYVDEWVHELIELAVSTGAARVVVDSLTEVREAASDDRSFRELVYALHSLLTDAGVSMVSTVEVPAGLRPIGSADTPAADSAANIVLCQPVLDGARLRRTLTVQKALGGGQDTHVRELLVEGGRVALGDVVDPRHAFAWERYASGPDQ